MKDGTATRLPATATTEDVVRTAQAIWNKRLATARETGKKLQQGPFTIIIGKPEDKTHAVYFVRPRQTGLEFYQRAPFGINFEQTVHVKTYGLDKPKK